MSEPVDHRSHDLGYLLVARQALADAAPDDSWTQRIDECWCHLRPRGRERRTWAGEVHVSAAPGAAQDVLARAVAVLARYRVSFRFAKDPQHLRELSQTGCAAGA